MADAPLFAVMDIDGVLADGANKARAIARPNMNSVKDILGLIR